MSTQVRNIAEIIAEAKENKTYNDPYAGINFVEFHPIIKDRGGKIVFSEKVIFPDYFRENDVTIVASKYLANQAKRKETDLREMIDRVGDTVTNWGITDGYFDSDEEALKFNYKLKYYQIHQYFSFNSPVYFNIGIGTEKPQLAACFITSLEDDMESITDLYGRESRLFKGGSGNGTNFSKLRSSKERVRGGGFASGPVSFLKASDTCAGIVKSGGTLRRAAKMACLNIDHPDIIEFVTCKEREEEKLRILKAAGFKPEQGRELSDEVYFQNTNLSIRLSDEFMHAVKDNGVWHTREVLTGKIVETFKARELLMTLSHKAWSHGDPGIQFHDNINAMNTVPDEGMIEASNPCVVGDTLLRSPEGDFKIRDLVDSGRTEIPVYCCDPSTGAIHIRMGRNPRKTGEKKPVYKVTFSKGRGGIHSITTTANHKFIDSDGNTVLCEDLIFEGKGKTRLMPFNKLIEKYRTSGGKEAYIYNKGMKIKESHLILNWKNGTPITFGRQANDLVAHHIDGNHLNNHPDNLEAILNTIHCSNHSSGENNARYGVTVSEESRQKMSEAHKSRLRERRLFTETCDQCSALFETSNIIFRKGKFCSPECRITAQNNKRQQRHLAWVESVKHECPYCKTVVLSNAVTCGSDDCVRKARGSNSDYDGVSYDRKRAAIASTKSKALNLGASFIFEGFDISTPNKWDMFLDADLETFNGSKRTTSKIILKYWGNWMAFLMEVESRNHIVLNVEYAGEEDVYNITVDEFHTVAWGEVVTHNCGEWNFLNDTQCNLAAFNAIKFFTVKHDKVVFDDDTFEDVMRTMITSQDLFCEHSSFPAEIIRKNAKRYRTIGAGFSNIAALCMWLGYPYDSDEARALISTISSLMTAVAYKVSADLADKLGTAEWWDNKANHASMFRVMDIHRKSADDIDHKNVAVIKYIKDIGCGIWNDILTYRRAPRAASVTLCAPTGTTGYLMSVDSFGPEPFFSIISYKTLSGNDGATIKLICDTPKLALKNLGYSDEVIDKVITDLTEHNIPMENSKLLKPEHIPIFDTSIPPENGKRSISYMGHVDMLAAIQPFISSAISKTINMSNDCTVEDVFNLFCYTWEKGLKSITVYRDGSKTEQVLNSSEKKKEEVIQVIDNRRKMPKDRDAKIHKFTINGNVEGYLTRGLHDNGDLGEIFITLSKDTPTLRGWADALATLTSIALQSGVSLELIVDKMVRRRFSPAGFTDNPEIRQCNSILDYLFRFIAFNHLNNEQLESLNLYKTNEEYDDSTVKKVVMECPTCNTELVKIGTCWVCGGCGYQSGSCG